MHMPATHATPATAPYVKPFYWHGNSLTGSRRIAMYVVLVYCIVLAASFGDEIT